MKGKKILIIPLVLLVSIGIFYLIKPTKLPIPTKIIIYNEGGQKELDKTNDNFQKIINLTNKRFHKQLYVAQDIVDDNSISNFHKDGLGIEFLYSESHTFTGEIPFTYDKLYFQLTSNKYGNGQGSTVYTFQHGNQGHYLEYSRGELGYSKELVDLVNKIK